MAAPATANPPLLDKISAVPMGQHAGLPIQLLSPQQLSQMVNATARGGYVGTRPGIWKLAVTYANQDVQVLATEALFQGAMFYRGFGNNPNCLLAQIGGRTFRYRINGSKVQVQDVSIVADLNANNVPQAWMWQGQDFAVINDGQSNPLFWDGAFLRRSGGYPAQELPAGRMGHYCNGRNVMVLASDPNAYIASDLVYNTASGTAIYNYRDSVLKIKDNITILQGRAFAVPIEAGEITSLFSVAIPDTSLGQGPLQVGTENGIYSVILPLDATLWTTTQQPSQTVSLPNGGPTGFYGVTTVNGDAWYRSPDGLRSFVVARRDFNTWVQTPLSFEMENILPFDTQSFLNHASNVTFKNRLLTTCSPYRVQDRGVAHRGLVALDFNNVSSLTIRSNPAYDGLWTGLPILQILKGKFEGTERCFIFALDADSKICLYELMPDEASNFDFDGTEDVMIESWASSGALFGRETDPRAVTVPLKKLITTDLFLEELAGEVNVNVKYRSDQYPFWIDWHEFNLCAPMCSPTCPTFEPPQKQYATDLRLPEPNDACNTVTGRPHRTGYRFQIRLAWTGHAKLNQALVWATPTQDVLNVVCADQECVLLAGCGEQYFDYSIEG